MGFMGIFNVMFSLKFCVQWYQTRVCNNFVQVISLATRLFAVKSILSFTQGLVGAGWTDSEMKSGAEEDFESDSLSQQLAKWCNGTTHLAYC